MRRMQGFTLIELMITVAIIAILSAIAYPSYQDHVRRAVRSKGQQFLLDVAQRQEQFFLEQRAYATLLGAGGLGMTIPPEVASVYQAPVLGITAPAPGVRPAFVISMAPIAGSSVGADGTLVVNNLMQTWREVSSPLTFVPKTNPNNAAEVGDCRWEESRCTPL